MEAKKIKTRKRGRPAGSGGGGGLFERNGRWGYRLRLDGRDCKTIVGTKEEATIALAREVENRRLGKAGMRRRAWMTLQQYVDRVYWPWSVKTKRPASLRSDASKFKAILSTLGDDRLENLTETRIDVLRERLLAKGLKATSINKHLHSVIAVLHHAVNTGAIETMPCRRVRLEREPPLRQIKDLSASEEATLLASLPPHHRWTITIALQTGMRIGEILALRWSAVDLDAGFLLVQGSKTNTSRRVPLSSALLTEMKKRRNLPDAWVTPGHDGGPTLHRTVWSAFKAAAKAAGRPEFTIHHCRHLVASRLLNSGLSIVMISDLLGHASLAMSRRYSHSDPNAIRAGLDKIARR